MKQLSVLAKSAQDRLASIVNSLLFPLWHIWHKKGKFGVSVFLVLIAFISTGCFQHYYKTNTQTSVDSATLVQLQKSNKHFVVHIDSIRAVGLTNVSVDSNRLEGSFVPVPAKYEKYLAPKVEKPNVVKKSDKKTVLNEVHLYTNNTQVDASSLSLPLSAINRIDVYTFDKQRTRESSIVSGISIGLGTIIVLIGLTFAVTFGL